MRYLLAIFPLVFLTTLSAQGQLSRIDDKVRIGDSTQQHQLILTDYSRFLGMVTSANEDSVTMRLATVPETIAFPYGDVRYVSVYLPGEDGEPEAVPESYPISDLTLVRTALPYQGRQRIKTVMFAYADYEWNLNENLQLGVGLAAIFGVVFNQRYRTSLREWLHVGLSNETVLVPFLGEFNIAGDLTTLVTVGTDRQFFNFGAGIFYANRSVPVRNYRLGLGTRVSPYIHLYGEIVAFEDDFGQASILPSLNLSLAKRRHRWSFGLMTVVIDGDNFLPPPIPYVSYALYY